MSGSRAYDLLLSKSPRMMAEAISFLRHHEWDDDPALFPKQITVNVFVDTWMMPNGYIPDHKLFEVFFHELSTRFPGVPIGLCLFGDDPAQPAELASIICLVKNPIFQLQIADIHLARGDMKPLVRAMTTHPQFVDHHIQIYFGEGLILEANDASHLALFTETISQLSKLEIIHMDFAGSGMDAGTMAKVAAAIALALPIHSPLQKLRVLNLHPETNLEPFFMVCRDRPNVKHLDLSTEGFGLSPTQIVQVAAFLGENPPVVDLVLCTESSVAPLALALATNTTLTRVDLRCPIVCESDIKSFVKAMEANYTLQSFAVTISPEVREEMGLSLEQYKAQFKPFLLYTNLNREFSRKHLLAPDSNASKNDWINALALANQRKEDFDVVFYYLSQNIGLIMEAHVEAESRRNAFFGMPAGSAGKKRDRQT